MTRGARRRPTPDELEERERTARGIERFVEQLPPGRARDTIAKLADIARSKNRRALHPHSCSH